MILETINSPADLKSLSLEQLNLLAKEARAALLEKTSQHGGHTGPNFGVVEMTIAMHYVFNSPVDKMIFDISHQSYVHKMLTGRALAFIDSNHYDDISGYTNPKESEHDLFTIGHTSTSLSLASGIAKARDLKQENYNVIAIIGDGSLSGGMAFEGLNQIATEKSNLIVVVNDNDQSIAKNPDGGIYQALKELRENNGEVENNFFKSLGFEYFYLDNGNDLEQLINLFLKVKDTNHPVLLHIHTIKGCGIDFMEKNREAFHAGGPYNPETGEYIITDNSQTYDSMTADFILNKMKNDPLVTVVNAGTPMMIFNQEQRKLAGKQFVDVGIAEQQAATMVTGLAKNGAKPIWCVYSTFLQRTYDQISHDMALNKQPATILVYLASVNGMNDETHLGFYDIPFLAHIPNLVYLAPTNLEEHLAMLNWSIEQNQYPVAIRMPVAKLKQTGNDDTTDYSLLNKNLVTHYGSKVAIFGLGNFYELGLEVLNELRVKHNIEATLINPKFISGLDTELLDSLSLQHQLVITLEDGIVEGGYGQMIASYLGSSSLKVKNFGISKKFHDRYNVDQLLFDNQLTVDQIVDFIVQQD